MSDDDWATVYPKPAPKPVEVELVGGPMCGKRLVVPDADEPLVVVGKGVVAKWEAEALGEDIETHKLFYRRRPDGVGRPSPDIVRFDFDYPKPIRA